MEWIDTLSPSAAQFLGAAVGVSGGLIAILAGALFNAMLNRRRDDRLRDQDARAAAAAIRGELGSIRLSVADLLPIWEEGQLHFNKFFSTTPVGINHIKKVNAAEYAKLPPSQVPIFEAYASRLGLLGSAMAGAISVLYTNYRVRAVIFEEPLEIKAMDLPDHFAEQIKWGRIFCDDCEEIERHLCKFEKTGKSVTLAEIQARSNYGGPLRMGQD